MTAPAPLKRSARDQLILYQGFALDHALAYAGGPPPLCGDCPPNPPRRPWLICPMCTYVRAFGDMSKEHTPPRGGASRLGPAVTLVLTCRRCNNTSGDTFESAATALVRGDETFELSDVQKEALARLQRQVEQPRRFRLIAQPSAFSLTDLKAAFLLGFAVLGYRWALASELAPIREAITQNVEPSIDQTVIVTLASSGETRENAVLEVQHPQPCVVVVAATGTAVVMPLPGGYGIPGVSALQNISARSYPWPPTVNHSKVNEVERAARAGHLFHADLCHGHWPERTAV